MKEISRARDENALRRPVMCGGFVSLVHSVFVYMVLQIRPIYEEENDEAFSLRIQFHVEI